jgi:hypothetical protein
MTINFIRLANHNKSNKILLFLLLSQIYITTLTAQITTISKDTACKIVLTNQTNQFRNVFYPDGDTSTLVFDSGSLYAEHYNTAFMQRPSQPTVSFAFSDPTLTNVYKLINRRSGKGGAIRIHLVEDLITQADTTTKTYIFSIKCPAQQCTNLLITDKQGTTVFERDLQEGQAQFNFNLDNLGQGVFLCNISHGFVSLYIQKLVISK